MTGLLKDVRFAGRMIFKNPGVASLAVLALAMGIGVTATMFSIVHGALIRGLPFEGGDRFMNVEKMRLDDPEFTIGVSIHEYQDWRSQQTSFEDLAAFYPGTVNIRGTERAERYDGAFITANGLTTLGVQPVLGRLFREDEDEPGAPMAIILGYQVWQDRFDRSRGVLGQSLHVNGESATIIGVMPEGFRFPLRQDVWIPLRMNPLEIDRNGGTSLDVYGRLREGVTSDQALVEFGGIGERLAAQYPETNEGLGVTMLPFTLEYIGEEAQGLLITMMAAVFLVLIVACANVANLLLARAALRAKEVAVRTALGASRLRVIFQLLAEALALSLLGAVLGAGIAWIGIDWFDNIVQATNPPYWLIFRLDSPIVLFVAGVGIVSGVMAGVIPAIKASSSAPHEILQDQSRGSSSLRIGRLTRALVVVEFAFSAAVLVVAGLMIKSVSNLRDIDLGFASEDVFKARVGLMAIDYPTQERRNQFFDELLLRLEDKPGVRSAALATALPGVGFGVRSYGVQGESYASDRDYPRGRWAEVSPGFFETFDVSIISGRGFTDEDMAGGLPVVIINESLAARHFGGEDPLGRQIRFGLENSAEPWMSVVGVMPDLWLGGLGNLGAEHAGMMVPLAQHGQRFMTVAIRADGAPLALTTMVRDQVAAIDADVPIYFVDTVAGEIRSETWFFRTFGTLFAVFGAIALFLASVGLYGVMSFGVSRRTQEVGIRVALGAQGRQVERLILRQGLGQIVVGLAIGLGVAAVLSRGVAILLFDVEPWDPAIFALIGVVLTGTGVLASLIPARRATGIDPATALRYE